MPLVFRAAVGGPVEVAQRRTLLAADGRVEVAQRHTLLADSPVAEAEAVMLPAAVVEVEAAAVINDRLSAEV